MDDEEINNEINLRSSIIKNKKLFLIISLIAIVVGGLLIDFSFFPPTFDEAILKLIDQDRWFEYSLVFKDIFQGKDVDLLEYMHSNDHSFTPLYPIIVASVDVLINNILLSGYITNGIISSATVLVFDKLLQKIGMKSIETRFYPLMFFITNPFFILTLYMYGVTDNLVILVIVCACFVNIHFLEKINIERGIQVFLINTVILFTREIIWPFLLIPSIYHVLLKIKCFDKSLKKSDILEISKVLYFTIILPCIIFVVFLLQLDLLPLIFSRHHALSRYTNLLNILLLMPSLLVVYGFFPFLVFRNRKGLKSHPLNYFFLLWCVIFFFARTFVPGPFLPNYWQPATFSWVILGSRLTFFKDNKPYYYKPLQKKIISIIIVLNLLLLTVFSLFYLDLSGNFLL